MPIRRLIAIGGAAAVVALALGACADGPEDPGSRSITIATTSIYLDWSLGSYAAYFSATQGPYDPLLRIDPETGAVGPWLAEEWQIGDDAKTIDFGLRDDVDFVDGTHLDAEGVAAMLTEAFTSDTSGWKAIIGTPYGASAEATGEYTVRITTTVPFREADLLFFPNLGIVSPGAIGHPELLEDGPLGSGPYLVDEIEPEVSISYVRNPDYWNPEAYPYDTVKFVVFDDEIAAYNALRTGQVDATAISGDLVAEAESSGLRINSGPGTTNALMVLDRDGESVPALGDKRVRQALNMAIDQASIVEAIEHGYGVVSNQAADGVIPGEYIEGGDDRYAFDIAGAKALLTAAGYPDGFVLPLPRISDGATKAYEAVIEQSFVDIGVTVEWIDNLGADLAQTIEAQARGEIPIKFPVIFQTVNPQAVVGLYRPGRGLVGESDDPEFRELIDDYFSVGRDEFAELQPKIAEYLLDEAWWIPFSRADVLWASVPEVQVNVRGYFQNLQGFTPAE
jgi:peptide/nickel transport system substrate-binding protein